MRQKKYPDEIFVGVQLDGNLAIVPNQSLAEFLNYFRPQKPAKYKLMINGIEKKRPVRTRKKVTEPTGIHDSVSTE